MFKNYLKTALKQLLAHKLYSTINVLGLAVGLACSILIGLYVLDEVSYDRGWDNAERIYRVSRDYFPTEARVAGRTPASINAPFAPQLQAEFPQVEASARLFPGAQTLVRRDEVSFQENRLMFVDASFVDIFSFEWLQGDPAQALVDPFSLVLTESMAAKYFGTDNPVGQVLTFVYTADVPMQVTGVIRDLPDNTHLVMNAMLSMNTLTTLSGPEALNNWNASTDYHSYIRLQPGADIANLETRFPAFMDRHVGENASATTGITAMAIADIHLRSTRTEELRTSGSLSNVYALAAIGICILLIACINFMNLSTARSSQRAKEVGMRKAVGAEHGQLIRQFLTESVGVALLAMMIALVMVELLLPWFNGFVGKSLNLNYLQAPVLVSLVVVVLLVGLVAGSYPAFVLASFQPVQVLKAGVNQGRKGALFRKVLVTLQFAIAIVLIVATSVIYSQMNFARQMDIGLEKEQVVVLSGSPFRGMGTQWSAMKQRLLQHPGITQVSSSHYTPFMHDDNAIPVQLESNAATELLNIKFMSVDYDFFATYGIEVLAGRDFSEERGDQIVFPDVGVAASGGFMLNESAARLHGWSAEAAAGQWLWLNLGAPVQFQILGVVEDSYFESLARPLEPMLFFVPPDGFRGTPSLQYGAVQITGVNLPETLAHIDAVWSEFLPDQPLQRHFLDEDFDALYASEEQQSAMLTYFTLLAIFVACLGLYGLASFNAERRTREIGVRKVLGGTVWSIVLLLTNDFSRLVLLANLIAWPVAWFAMSRWLEGFSYRIDLTPLVFIGGGLIALLIAWVTVAAQAAKAANANPVLALKYE